MTDDVTQILNSEGCTLSLPAGENRTFIMKDDPNDSKKIFLLLKLGGQMMLIGHCERSELKRVTRGL